MSNWTALIEASTESLCTQCTWFNPG